MTILIQVESGRGQTLGGHPLFHSDQCEGSDMAQYDELMLFLLHRRASIQKLVISSESLVVVLHTVNSLDPIKFSMIYAA